MHRMVGERSQQHTERTLAPSSNPLDNLMINAGGWYLYLEQEFVYVGDAAIVEPSGRTQRLGADVSVRYQPLKWLGDSC